MDTPQNPLPLPASDLFGDLRALEIGERILDGDLVWWQDQFFPATDTGNGVMSINHFPHYRSPNKEISDG